MLVLFIGHYSPIEIVVSHPRRLIVEMERETKLLTDMLNNLHEIDISLSGTDIIHESQVARQLYVA